MFYQDLLLIQKVCILNFKKYQYMNFFNDLNVHIEFLWTIDMAGDAEDGSLHTMKICDKKVVVLIIHQRKLAQARG